MRLPNWVRLPGRTVRVRLTVLYTLLFLISGALLLAIASGVAVGRSSSMEVKVNANAGPQSGQASDRIHMLQSQVAHLQAQVARLQSEVAGQPGQSQLGHVLLISSLIAPVSYTHLTLPTICSV